MIATLGRRSSSQSIVGLGLGAAAGAVAHERRALEAARALLGRRAPVRLEVADDEVGALLGGQPRVAEHLVGLADARGGAEVEAQESTQMGRDGHGPSVGRARGPDAFFRRSFRRSAAVLFGASSHGAVRSSHGHLRRRPHLRALRGLRRLPRRDRAAVTTSQVVGLIVAIGLFLYFVVAPPAPGALLMAPRSCSSCCSAA